MSAGFPYPPPFRLGERELALAERLVAALERLAGSGRLDESGRAAGVPSAVSHSAPGACAPARGQTEPEAAGGSGESGAVGADEAPPAPPPVPPASVRRAAWRTEERADVLRAQWPAGAMVAELRPVLAALPGGPLPDNAHIATWATDLGLRRPAGFRQRMGLKWTPERAELVREMWRSTATNEAIAEAVNARLGPATTGQQVNSYGRKNLGLPPRADVRAPGVVKWTPERVALVREMWPSDATNEAIAAAVNALPGPATTGFQVGAYGRDALRLPPRRDVRASRPVAPPRPVAPQQQETWGGTGAGAPGGSRVAPPSVAQVVPALPPPGPDGKIAATFAQIRAWAAGRHLEYDGTNIEAVNKLRALMGGAPPVVQVEA